MKRWVSLALVVLVATLFVFSTPASAFAQEQNALRKLLRGVSNTFGGFAWEVCHNVEETYEDEGVVIGATYGVGKGFLYGIGRTMVGFFETITFFIPNKRTADYSPILDDPEFPFQIEKLKEEADY